MTDEIWACGVCRSINKAKLDRCYKCRTPRAVASVDPGSLPVTAGQAGPVLARPPFRSTRGLALLASILILAVAALRVLSLVTLGPLIQRVLGGAELTQADLDRMVNLGYLSLFIPLAALIVWAYWLSRVITVMPALDLGYPHTTGLTSFVECLIPIFNFFRVPAILRDVTRRVAPQDGRGDALIACAWLGIIGGFILERVGAIFIGLKATSEAQLIGDSLALAGLTAALTIVGIGFLVYLTWWIEARLSSRHTALDAVSPSVVSGASSPPAAGDAPAQIPDGPPKPVAEPFAPVSTVAAVRSVHPETSPRPTGGPHLQVRISGDTIEASLDGTGWEDVSLTELGQAAVAIRDAAGAVTLTAGDAVVAAGLGRDALDAIRRSGATYDVVPA
jgi:hypothetical protein